jgi:hypothetical protein
MIEMVKSYFYFRTLNILHKAKVYKNDYVNKLQCLLKEKKLWEEKAKYTFPMSQRCNIGLPQQWTKNMHSQILDNIGTCLPKLVKYESITCNIINR